MHFRLQGPGAVRWRLKAIACVSLATAISVAATGTTFAARGKMERTHVQPSSQQSVSQDNAAIVGEKVQAPAPKIPPSNDTAQRLVLDKGETLFNLLLRNGIAAEDVAAATQAIGAIYDMRHIQPGDAVLVRRGPMTDGASEQRLTALHLEVPEAQHVTVVRGADGRFSKLAATHGSGVRVHRRTVVLNSDLRSAMKTTSLPASVSRDIVRAVQADRVFAGKPRKGSHLTVVYEVPTKGAGAEPTLRFASLKDGAQEHRLYRYPLASSEVAYLDEKGRGIAVVTLDTPIGARPDVSSGWGWRIHPVLGRKKFHRGVDYRAPRGTPALAAGDGVVEDIGWRGNYGLYLRIRHGANLSTAYAHMDRFASALHKGTVVRKGQPVGYVGTTGMATGPHLYYEVLVDNRQVNPLKKDNLAIPVRLQNDALAQFKRYVQSTRQIIED